MSASPVPFAAAPRGGLVALALLLVYVVWGSTYLGIAKALHGGALPLTMVSGSRFIIAGGLMFLAMLAMTGLRLGFDHPRYPLMAAIALPLCAIGGVAWALLTWYFNERILRALQQRG